MTSPNGPGGAARRPRNTESLSELMARQSLEALRWNWDGAYEFRVQGSEWVAERADGLGVVTAPGPSELADKVHADYSARPVPRDLPPKGGR